MSSNTVAVVNAAGTSQNPGTGTIKFITTLLAVDVVNADDIVIGVTDSNGILVMDKLFKSSNFMLF